MPFDLGLHINKDILRYQFDIFYYLTRHTSGVVKVNENILIVHCKLVMSSRLGWILACDLIKEDPALTFYMKGKCGMTE